MSDVTQMLQAVGRGQARATEDLLPLVYDELRRLAAARMAQEAAGQTLQATALVHEAWLRLVGDGERTWDNRAHFFGAAAEVRLGFRKDLIARGERVNHRGSMRTLEFLVIRICFGFRVSNFEFQSKGVTLLTRCTPHMAFRLLMLATYSSNFYNHSGKNGAAYDED
jgi:hypothetical protein